MNMKGIEDAHRNPCRGYVLASTKKSCLRIHALLGSHEILTSADVVGNPTTLVRGSGNLAAQDPHGGHQKGQVLRTSPRHAPWQPSIVPDSPSQFDP